MDRKLAAILAADIVGYSKLMGADEAGTLSDVRQFFSNVLGPEIAGNRGKLVKSMGDGWLIEFASVVDAINCSMKVQDCLLDRGRFKLRIGVHIGDVIEEQGDIFGDGVNVAARLETIAEPGGIAISDITYSSLDGTLTPSFDDAGERELKNIARPIRVWIRDTGEITVPARSADHGRTAGPGPGSDPSDTHDGLSVLVFQAVTTPSQTPEVRDLADALTFDIRAHLSSVRWLDVKEESGAGMQYELRSVLRDSGDRLRLELTFLDHKGQVLWRTKRDGTLPESFDFQDEVVDTIPAELLGVVLDAEMSKMSGKTLERLTAKECLLSGMMAYKSVSADSFRESLAYYAAAIGKDPALPIAYAEAIFMTVGGGTTGFRDQLTAYFDQLPGWVEAALAMDAEEPMLDLSVAVATYMKDQEIAPVLANVRDCLRRAPFDVQVLVFSGWGLIWSGQSAEALDCFLKTEKLGRFSPYLVSAFGGASTAHVHLGDDDAAIHYAQKGLATAHEYPTLFACLASASAHKGRDAEAREAIGRYLELVPGQTVAQRRAISSYGGSAGADRFYEGLIMAGMPEG